MKYVLESEWRREKFVRGIKFLRVKKGLFKSEREELLRHMELKSENIRK
jgi:hypothetical protein